MKKALQWRRGPASIDGAFVHIPAAKARSYVVPDDIAIPLDLARVRSETDACAFATKWGLTAHGRPGQQLREPSSTLLHAAVECDMWLRELLEFSTARRAPAKAEDTLREHWSSGLIESDDGEPPTSIAGPELLRMSEEAVAVMVVRARASFVARDGATLMAQALSMVADLLRREVLVGACEECNFIFALSDPRQRFCSEACSNKARQRRWYANHEKNNAASKRRSERRSPRRR